MRQGYTSSMSRERLIQGELFATPDDIIAAHRIVEQELGAEFDVNFLGLPKNVGNKGDGRHYGHSVVISSASRTAIRPLLEEACEQARQRAESLARKEIPTGEDEALQVVASRICNTTTATRVLLDITPDDGRFSVQS